MASKKEIAYRKKVQELIRGANNLGDAEVKKVIGLLAEARKNVAATVASTDWQIYHLPQMKAAIDRALNEFGDRYKMNLREAQRNSWGIGVDMVDMPIREIGIYAPIPEIDTTVLGIMQGYSSDLVTGLTRDAIAKINNELTMGLMGQKTPYEVMQGVGRNLNDKSIFRSIAERAETITRNETGRVLEMASQARRMSAAQVVPGLKKQWVHGTSSKLPRITHLAAHGQIKAVDEPFLVGGEALMYPRDPAGSARNTINCACFTVPYLESMGEATLGSYDEYVAEKKWQLGEDRAAAAIN